ncbi:MAG: ABC transporter permease [Lewinellaceae bacterium]|nr:ABC transporter permease [Lewinellaceae bacterium]
MRTIFFLLRKEFRQIFRHRVLLMLIFVMPIIQLIILANAADYEVRNILLHVIDHDLSPTSYRLVNHFQGSPHFILTSTSFNPQRGIDAINADKADLVLEIPAQFERRLLRENSAQLHLNINAINGVKAGLAQGYANNIIRNFNQDIRAEWLGLAAPPQPGRIAITYSNWFNPEMAYSAFMVPGILVMLVTLVGMFLSGINIVKEKEIGTIEQINVTPIRKSQFIIGKLLPFWIIGLVELAIGLGVGKLIFDIPMVGNLGLVFLFAAIYMLVVLGIGLLVSTITETQQQAMFISWFFLIVFILMSGLFTPIESMPLWAQRITWFNPIAYFVEVNRLILLKGSSFMDIRPHLGAMVAFAFTINGLAVWNYRKRS